MVECLDLEVVPTHQFMVPLPYYSGPQEALMAFLEWLTELGGNVVLVAHKCLDYDAKVKAGAGMCRITAKALASINAAVLMQCCSD